MCVKSHRGPDQVFFIIRICICQKTTRIRNSYIILSLEIYTNYRWDIYKRTLRDEIYNPGSYQAGVTVLNHFFSIIYIIEIYLIYNLCKFLETVFGEKVGKNLIWAPMRFYTHKLKMQPSVFSPFISIALKKLEE